MLMDILIKVCKLLFQIMYACCMLSFNVSNSNIYGNIFPYSYLLHIIITIIIRLLMKLHVRYIYTDNSNDLNHHKL